MAKTFYLILCLIVFTVTPLVSQDSPLTTHSPDRSIAVQFHLINNVPHYNITVEDIAVIRDSKLGFTFQNMAQFANNFTIDRVSRESRDETWETVWGASNTVRNHYNEMTIELREATAPHRTLVLVFRAFNDGIGFRYMFPEQENLKRFVLMSEDTEFHLAGDYTAWWIPANYDSYEQRYSQTPVSQIDSVNTPITLKTQDGLHLSIHEANLTDFAGMTLKRSAGTTLRCELVPAADGTKVTAQTPHASPWRTIQIAESAGELIQSDLIINLNAPNTIEDTSWIRPGNYIGIWWGMHIGKYSWHQGPKHGATTENTKRYIDFASKHGIPYVLVEGWNVGWEDNWKEQDFSTPYDDYNLEELVEYARQKKVEIIAHNETGGDAADYDTQLETAYRLYERLGIHSIKTGYAGSIIPEGEHHHGQWMVNHYRRVIQKAAEHHLMIDAHEPIKPTGIRRTYPNFMTREGVRGMEYNAWSEGNPPEHTTILPFTRMLAGPLDYTPGIFDLHFDEYRPKRRVHSTLANQLALYPVLFSPLQMLADLPGNYEEYPEALKFIADIPSDWETTVALNCEIGDYVTIARKNGDNWYLGSLTDEHARTLSIPLDFLEPQTYVAHIYRDGDTADWETNPYSIVIEKYLVEPSTMLQAKLAAGGGMAVRLSPASTREIESLDMYSMEK
mgnify:CR=1 FL=1